MKKNYCKYCGLELEKGSCVCKKFLANKDKHSGTFLVCDTCEKKIDSDSVYCPYCGIPIDVDGNIKALQKELRGENALDVLEVYRQEDINNGIRRSKTNKLKLTMLISVAIILSMIIITFATFILPIVRDKISEYQLKKELESASIYDSMKTEETTINNKIETVEIETSSNIESNLSDVIKGVDPNKKYELYVKEIKEEKITIERGELKCDISYYIPVIDGVDEKEVAIINEMITIKFDDFRKILLSMANESSELPKSIVFNIIEQKAVNSNRVNILTHGKFSPRNGLVEKKKFRFVYDRKSQTMTMRDISD